MALYAQHLPQLEFMEKYATSTDPVIVFERTKLEKYYHLQAASFTQAGMSARKVLEALQAEGRLPRVSNLKRFEIPVLNHDGDDLLREPSVDDASASVVSMGAKLAATAVLPSPALTSPYSGPSEDVSVSRATAVVDPEEAERRRREQQVKQAKVLAEKEKEQEMRRAIREQIDKDRAEKTRQEEERRAKRALDAQQGTANGAIFGAPQPSVAHGLQVPSTATHGQHTSPIPSPRGQKPTMSQIEPTQNPEGPVSGGHWFVPSAQPPAEAPSPVPGLNQKEYTQYQSVLAKLESEVPRATKMIQLLESVRGDSAFPEKDEALAQWRRYSDALHSDITMVRLLLRSGPGSGFKIRDSSEALPSAPTGFTLRDTSKSATEAQEEEVEVQGKALEMREGEEKWRIRVHLLEGPPVLLTLNPSHTVHDLMAHIATLTNNLTNRYKLEIAGQPGELAPEWTAERAGLKATTVRLVLK